eukprot:gene4154-34973_t
MRDRDSGVPPAIIREGNMQVQGRTVEVKFAEQRKADPPPAAPGEHPPADTYAGDPHSITYEPARGAGGGVAGPPREMVPPSPDAGAAGTPSPIAHHTAPASPPSPDVAAAGGAPPSPSSARGVAATPPTGTEQSAGWLALCDDGELALLAAHLRWLYDIVLREKVPDSAFASRFVDRLCKYLNGGNRQRREPERTMSVVLRWLSNRHALDLGD